MSMFLSLENISVLFFQVIEAKDNKTSNKYSVKPPKDLRSKFEMKMEDKQRKEEEEKEKKLLDEEAQRIAVRISKDKHFLHPNLLSESRSHIEDIAMLKT